MKSAILSVLLCVLTLAAAVPAQGANPGQSAGEGAGRRGGSFGRGLGMGLASGLIGTVTEVAADHYSIKTDAGVAYTVYFSVNTRIFRQPAQGLAPAAQQGQRSDQGQRGDYQRSAPQPLKPTDIKVGDPIVAIGEVDASAKSVGAVSILQVDPERARQMREMQANYGKTWLMGKVTAIDGVKVTLFGPIDNASHTFVAEENTTFRKHREPITLADVQPGDTMRVEGALKDGTFVAATVTVMGAPQGDTPRVPRDSQLPAPPR